MFTFMKFGQKLECAFLSKYVVPFSFCTWKVQKTNSITSRLTAYNFTIGFSPFLSSPSFSFCILLIHTYLDRNNQFTLYLLEFFTPHFYNKFYRHLFISCSAGCSKHLKLQQKTRENAVSPNQHGGRGPPHDPNEPIPKLRDHVRRPQLQRRLKTESHPRNQ